MNYKYRKISLIILPLLIIGVITPDYMNAQSVPAPNPFPAFTTLAEALGNALALIPGAAVGGIMYFVGLILGFISGVFLNIAGYLVTLSLNINLDLFNSLSVKTGWEYVLTITNLGFILGIIIIAFGTIFRIQNYAIKQILWKLIVAALLVNFSLVIAGAFINISDIISKSILTNGLDGEGGLTSPAQWADSFAGMFKAQALLKLKGFEVSTGGVDRASAGFNAIGTFLFQAVASVFFVAIFTLMAAITLLSTAIMLLIRYVYLGILLILSPIVWLLWIFPSTTGIWKMWWSNFIKWTFFAPIVLFFLSLAMNIMKNKPKTLEKAIADPNFTANTNLTLGLGVIGEMAIVIGLVIGGLMAANSLSITFSGTAIGWAQKSGKMFGSWAGRKGAQYGTGVLRYKKAEPGSKSLAEHAQNWASNRTTRLGKFGAGLIATGAAKLSAVGGENLVKEAEKRTAGMTPLQRKAAILTADVPTKIAILKTMGDKKELKGIDAGIYKNEKTENEFARFSQQNTYKEVNHASGLGDRKMYEAAKEATKTGDTTALREATNKYIKSLKLADVSKGDWNALFSEHDEKNPVFKLDKNTRELLGKDIGHGLAEHLPGAFNKTTPAIEGKNMDNYINITREQIRMLKREDLNKGERAEKSFESNIGWFTLGTAGEAPSTAPTPPPSPGP